MTEIPEHLLKRAQARRAAMEGGGAPEGDAAPAAPAAADVGATPAPAASAPAKREPAPLPTLDEGTAVPAPDSPVVAAAKNRKRIPYWAAPVLALLPLWALIYMYSVRPPDATGSDPLVIGAEVYAGNCAGCHLPNGAGSAGGGVGQQLNEGHVLETFPDPLSMVHWLAFGATEGARADGTYGDPARPGGAMNVSTLPGQMPGFGTTLTTEELAAVTIYTREVLSGGAPADDPGFNSETFAADPTVNEEEVQTVIDLGPTGDPDLSAIATAETAAG